MSPRVVLRGTRISSAAALRQFIHRHPVDAGPPLFCSDSLQRGKEVTSSASLPVCRSLLGSRFRASPSALPHSAAPEGFTSRLHREFQLPGHLRLGTFEAHGRFAPSFRLVLRAV